MIYTPWISWCWILALTSFQHMVWYRTIGMGGAFHTVVPIAQQNELSAHN